MTDDTKWTSPTGSPIASRVTDIKHDDAEWLETGNGHTLYINGVSVGFVTRSPQSGTWIAENKLEINDFQTEDEAREYILKSIPKLTQPPAPVTCGEVGEALGIFNKFCAFIDDMHMSGTFVENDFMNKTEQGIIKRALSQQPMNSFGGKCAKCGNEIHIENGFVKQQPDAELLEALKKKEYHNLKVKAFLEQEKDDGQTKRAEQKGGQ